MTFLSRAKDFLSTKRVCGIGPSTESTSKRTPAEAHSLHAQLLLSGHTHSQLPYLSMGDEVELHVAQY